jgi:hypothetical protein
MTQSPPIWPVRSQKKQSVVDIRDFGLVEGQTYTSAQFKPIFDSASASAVLSGNRLYIPAINYTASAPIDLLGGLNVFFSDAFICTRAANINVFRQIGTTSASAINLSSSVNNDSSGSPVMFGNTPSYFQELQLAAGSLATLGGINIGDWVGIICDTKVTTFKSPNDGKYGTMRRVVEINGEDLTISSLVRPFFTATNARVLKLNLTKGATLQGGKFTDDAAIRATSFLEPYFLFYLTESPSIQNTKIYSLGGKAIDLNWTYNGQVTDRVNIFDLPSDESGGQYGYGVLVSGGSLHGRLNGCSITRTRHGFTTDRNFRSGLLNLHGEPESFEVSGNTISDNYNSSIDTHEEGHQILITNNLVNGGRTGINLRSKGCIVSNNIVQGTVDYGIAVQVYGYDALVTGNVVRKVNKDNRLTYGGIGIYVGNRATISNNILWGNRLTDIYLGDSGGSDTVQQTDAKVSGNIVSSANGIHVDTAWNRVTVQGNVGNCTTNFVIEAATVQNTSLSGNINNGAGGYSLAGANRFQLGNKGLADIRGIESASQSLTTAGTPVSPSGNIVAISSTTTINSTATPFIQAGASGQRIVLFNEGTSSITVLDNSVLAGSLLNLDGKKSLILGPGTTTQWIYLSSQWRLVSSSQGSTEVITQAAHGFIVGNTIRATASGYAKAQANSVANSRAVSGRVVAVIDANTFILQDSGVYGSGFTAGAEYWLSPTTAGGDQTTAPTTSGQVVLPVGIGTPSGQFRILIQPGIINP